MAKHINRLVSYNEIATNIRMANSSEEIARIIQRNPDLMYSSNCNAALLQTIPKIVPKSSENYVNLRLVYWIVAAGRYRSKVEVNNAPERYGMPCTKEVFSCYIYSLVEHHGSGFLKDPFTVPSNLAFMNEIPSKKLNGNYKLLLSLIYLIINYSRWDNRDMRLWQGLHRDRRSDYLYAFIGLFADVALPMDRVEDVCTLVRWFWEAHCIDPDDPRDSPMFPYIRSNDPSALYELLNRAYHENQTESVIAIGDVVEDATELLMQFGNTLYNQDIQAMYFDEAASMLSMTYPLDDERLEIAEKYKPIFGDDAILYMADIYGAVMTNLSQINDSSLGRYQHQDCPSQRLVNMRAEGIILDMIAKHHPLRNDVMSFFKDTMNAFSYNMRYFSDGARQTIDQIITGIFDEIEQGSIPSVPGASLETYQNYIAGMTAAMEGSYDGGDSNDAPKTVKRTSPTKKSTSRVDALDAHSNATTGNVRSKV
ncbi:MAG: hypothetical protein K2F99_02165, partial [Muribaculaceae bacterium]|nr:hypothetical protein [Muribaculaceae bacterium]